MNYYGREIGFYRDCAGDCGVKVPAMLQRGIVQEDNRFAMIIEDLAPASPVDQGRDAPSRSLQKSCALSLTYMRIGGTA